MCGQQWDRQEFAPVQTLVKMVLMLRKLGKLIFYLFIILTRRPLLCEYTKGPSIIRKRAREICGISITHHRTCTLMTLVSVIS